MAITACAAEFSSKDARQTVHFSEGTSGSNPVSSSGESAANLILGAHRIDWPPMALPTLALLTPTVLGRLREAAAIARIIARALVDPPISRPTADAAGGRGEWRASTGRHA